MREGGQVRAPGGDGFHRIFLTNGCLPGLAVARSIGDTLAGNAGVIALPEIKGKSPPSPLPLRRHISVYTLLVDKMGIFPQ